MDVPAWGFAALLLLEQEGHLKLPATGC